MTQHTHPRELYRAVVLEHARTPHNFGRLADASHRAEGNNPLCGDRIMLYLRATGTQLAEVTFDGAGCAISIASASMLTDALKGASLEDAGRIAGEVYEWLNAGPGNTAFAIAGPVESLAEVRAFPTRVRCASLPWQTFRAALRSDAISVTTEAPGAA